MAEVYTYFTSDVIGEFGGSGSESLLQIFEGLPENNDEKELIVAQLFTELLLVFQDEKLESDTIVQFLYSCITNDLLARIFCQILNVFPTTDEKIKTLVLLLSRKENVIKPDTMATYISPDLLKESGVVPKDVLTKTVNSRIRDEFYTQKKYNLIHEEIEGYSKLIVELYNIVKFHDSEHQVDYALQIIEKLIGHYSLDPNKCLDILLDILSNLIVSQYGFVLSLLKKSRWWPLVEADNSSLETLSVGGSEAGAKILGIKFLKTPSEAIPETARILVAFLIKEGFISFGSFYNYLKPNDEVMAELEKEYKKDLEDKVSKSGASALALAAPLALDDEDDISENSNKAKASVTQAEPVSLEKRLLGNHKFQMLKVFLSTGCYWPSIYVLTEYPFLAHIDEEVAPLINRIIDSMISPLYSSPFTPNDIDNFQAIRKVAKAGPQNHVSYDKPQVTRLYTFKPLQGNFGTKQFTYFYHTWSSSLPVISSPDDLLQVVGDLLKFNGINLSRSLETFVKLCKIITSDLSSHDERKTQWYHFFRNYIFPTMTIIEENSIAIEAAYSILSFYPLEDRFSVYGELYQVLAKNNPQIKMAYNKAEKSTKDILRRLSKENVRPMMRRLAKISFANPLPCFLTILQQIESYDNLIPLVVETARYFNEYGWDTLTIAILMRLTASGRSSIQDNGMNERKWLQSLSSFIGKICQRYPNSLDISTLLTFLLKSFHSGDSLGVIVLKEILISMGGIQTIINLTLRQINMINCGSSLEKLVYKTIDDVRYERSKSGGVLVNTLLELEGVNELLVLLCRLSKETIIESDLTHLKVLASKNDDLESVIHLFTTLINFFGKPEAVEKDLLSISELRVEYDVPIEWAFDLWRPLLGKRANEESANDSSPWNPVLYPVIQEVSSILPTEITEFLAPGLYVTFWQLYLFDINYSSELYDTELTKLASSIKSLKDSTTINSKDRDISRAVIDKAKNDLRQAEEFLKIIPQDKENHSKHDSVISNRLTTESSHWFPLSGSENLKRQSQIFLQYCVLPRSIHSSFDAGFTAKFLFKLHELGTANFSLIGLLDELIKGRFIFGTLFTLTPSESENLGLFFADILKTLHDWTVQSVYETGERYDVEGNLLSYDDFRNRLYEYHDIILQEIGIALRVTEYMSRRNAITFLKNLLGVYPNVEDHCEQVVNLIQNITDTEEREDLKLSSSALIGHVKSRSKDWVHKWDFIPMTEEDKNELINKRKQEKEKKLAIIREKQLKIQKEKDEKIRKEREEEEKKKRQNLLNYDSQKATTPESSARLDRSGASTSRGRYDNYSKYDSRDEKKEVEAEKEKKPEAKIETKTETKVETKPETKEVAKESSSEKETTTKDKKEPSPEKPVDLKARLLQAKKEYQEKAAREQKKEAPRPRAPLPPQGSLPKDTDPRYGRYSENYNSSGRYNSARDKVPPRAPVSSYQDRKPATPPTYPDRKQGATPTYNDRKQGTAPSNRPEPKVTSQSSYNKTTERKSSTPGQDRSKAPSSRPPPPPPPPPPVSLKNRPEQFSKRTSSYDSRGQTDYQTKRSDNYDSRDGYNGRYGSQKGNQSSKPSERSSDRSEKRQHDGYNSRGYDKKSRY